MKRCALISIIVATAAVMLVSGATAAVGQGIGGQERETGPRGGLLDHAAKGTRLDEAFGRMPLYFIENQGQLHEEVAFYVQGSDKTLYFTSSGVTFALVSGKAGAGTESTARPEIEFISEPESTPRERWAVKLDFVGARPGVRPIGEEYQEAVISYFKGRAEDWYTGLPTYGKIIYPDIWPGIDLVYSGTVNRLKYEFVVKPGADPSQIRLAYRGASSVALKETGELIVSTPLGGFEDARPYAYQDLNGQGVEVAMAYALNGTTSDGVVEYGFSVGAYDPTRLLILDPAVLVYCGYIGGAAATEDFSNGIAVDGSGCAYVVGWTECTQASFPVTVGPDLTFNGGCDAYVAKVNASGTGLVYCGYIGGTGFDYGNAISVDDSENAHVVGNTMSTQASFPVTVGPDLTHNGSSDVFVAKMNAAGTGLIYCGYIGGTNADQGWGIAVDESGYAHVTGYTNSTEASFPVAVGPDLTYNGGSCDAFVAKVNPTGTAPLVHCGFIGGTGWDLGMDIATWGHPPLGQPWACVTGWTNSSEATFPVAVGPDLTYNGGTLDAFVASVNATGLNLVRCGYIGGEALDKGYGIALRQEFVSVVAYVTGVTESTEATFPVTTGPDLTHNGSSDAFVARVNASWTSLDYCGYIGGTNGDGSYGIALDDDGNAYVMGSTGSSQASFPVVSGPDVTYNGNGDAFVAKVDATGTFLAYCGYIGGSEYDDGSGVAVDSYGAAYVTGGTGSSQASFPVTVGPDLTFNGGQGDAFVAKVALPPVEWGETVDNPVDLSPYFDWGAISSYSGLVPPGNMGIYSPPHDTGFYFPSDSLTPPVLSYPKAWLTPGVHLASDYGPGNVRITSNPLVAVADRNSKLCTLYVEVPSAALIDDATDENIIRISSGTSKTIPIVATIETMVFLASCDGLAEFMSGPSPDQPLEVRLSYGDGTVDTVVFDCIHPAGRLDIVNPAGIFIYGNEVFVCDPAYFDIVSPPYYHDPYHSEAWHWYAVYPDTTKLLTGITFVGIQSGAHSDVYISALTYSGEVVRDTVVCEPQIGGNPTHPPIYWYDVTPGGFGRCDFHVRVCDSIAVNYTNWVEPANWTHQVHKVGSKWWVSWWDTDPGCANAIYSTFRFQFDNPNPSCWDAWTTTTSNTNNPYAGVVDSSGNHSGELDGYGYRVHVPRTPPTDTCIRLDNVFGLDSDSNLVAGQSLRFNMRWTYSTGSNIKAFQNGFKVYSPDGATWLPITLDTVSHGWRNKFDMLFQIGYFGVNGMGADTAYIGGVAMMGPGVAAPFDTLVWWISTQVYPQDSGKHLCLDSSWFPPAGPWSWYTGSQTIFPGWDGPHCFEITNVVPVRDTVICEPQGGGNPNHPPTYWYDVTPGDGTARHDFHVKVYDSIAGNYTNWIEPPGWTHQVHKIGSDWWVSFCDPSSSNPVTSTTRFGFDNADSAIWSDWRTSTDGSCDPYGQIFDSAANHSGDPDGYGYRVHVPKLAPPSDTVKCEPQGGSNPSHPGTYWYDVTPDDFGRCDFHVRVYDSDSANYSNWVEPSGWQHLVHKVGSEWWVSWWNPGCTDSITSTFRFQFDNSDTSAVWGHWTTTISGTNDPFALVIDSSGNHSGETDGYGYRVHVPMFVPPPHDSSITLDAVIGEFGGGILAGDTIKFIMRLTYNPGADNVMAFANGFRVYSPDGATWQAINADTVSLGWMNMFELGVWISYHGVSGTGADTVGFGGAAIFQGLSAPFHEHVWWIETKVFAADSGKHLCVDSSWFPPTGLWRWSAGMASIIPDWGGPYCFEIIPPFCIPPMRGNIDYDPGDVIDIADLVYLVDYMFSGGPAPVCVEEANVDGSCCAGGGGVETLADIDIADLVYLVDYMFNLGPAPVACP